MWDLWWTKWHWNRFLLENLSFPVSLSFHQCTIFMHLSVTSAFLSYQLTVLVMLTKLCQKSLNCNCSILQHCHVIMHCSMNSLTSHIVLSFWLYPVSKHYSESVLLADNLYVQCSPRDETTSTSSDNPQQESYHPQLTWWASGWFCSESVWTRRIPGGELPTDTVPVCAGHAGQRWCAYTGYSFC